MNEALFLLLATYFAHSTVLLAGAWAAERVGLVRSPGNRELLWRFALLAGVATTAAQWAPPVLDSGALARIAARGPASVAVAPELPGAARTGLAAVAPREPAAGDATHRILATPGRSASSAGSAPMRTAWALPSDARAVAPWIAGAWLFAGIAGTLWLAFAMMRRIAALARFAPCIDAEALAIVRRVCRAKGLREPRVVYDPDSLSPTANIGGVLTLPPWALGGIGAQGLEALLAHELGHLARRDIAWRLLIAFVRILFWFQPLNALAARRLEALAELGADSWAVGATGNRRALAECLARCAAEIGRTRAPVLAIAMFGGSPLIVRIQHLLQENQMKFATVRPIHRLLIALALLFAAATLPIVVIAPAAAGRSTHIETSDSLFGGSYTKIELDGDGLELSAEIRGDITFSAAEDDVVALAEGDEAYIEQVVDGVKRRIEFEQDAGKLVRRYSVDGKVQPLDAAGRTWLRTVIPSLFREAGIDAEARAKRIHARGGAGAVLDEVALIHGNYVRRVYIGELAKLGPMSAGELDRAIGLAGEIEGDFERREAFGALIENQKLGAQQQVVLLGRVATMESDFEQRTVLAALAPTLVDEAAVGSAWARALDAIDSSFERREALAAVAGRKDLGESLIGPAFGAIEGISSDFEKRTALAALAPHVARNPQLAVSYAKVTQGIGSNFERREALLALLADAPIDAAAARAVLDATADIDSDFEQLQVLLGLASRMPADPALIERYREIARGMNDYERGQAEKALDRFAG